MNTQSIIITIALQIFVLFLFIGAIRMSWRMVFGDTSPKKPGTKKQQTALAEELRRALISFLHFLMMIVQTVFRMVGWLFSHAAGRKKKSGKLYTARWATKREIQKLLSPWNKGVCIDGRRQLRQTDCYKNTMVIAASGMGKSSSVLLPTLLRLDRRSSAIVHDPSGELARKSEHWLRKRGFQVYHLNAAAPERSIRFNVLHSMTTEAAAQEYAEMIVSFAYRGGKQGDPFWSNSARNLLTALLCMLLPERERGFCTMENLRHLLSEFRKDPAALAGLAVQNLSDRMFAEYAAILSDTPNTLKNIALTVASTLAIFQNENVARVCSGHTVDVLRFRTEPSVLFLQVPERKIPKYNAFIAMVLEEFINRAAMVDRPHDVRKRDWLPIHFLLDEFGQMAVPGFAELVATIRKYRCMVTILLQEPAQLEAAYGKEKARVIVSNMYNRLYMAGQGLATLREVEAMMGRHTVAHDDPEGKKRESARALMTADELRLLQRGEAVFMQANSRPMFLHTRPWEKSFWLRRRVTLADPPNYEHLNDEMKLLSIPALQGTDMPASGAEAA